MRSLCIVIALTLGLAAQASAQFAQPTGCPASDSGAACLGSGGSRAGIALVVSGATFMRVAADGTITFPNSATVILPSGATFTDPTITVSSGSFKLGLPSQAAGDLLYADAATTYTRLAAGTAAQFLIGGTVPSWGSTLTKTALATTSTDGFVVTNTTAATGGATVQISPRVRLRGNAWDTAASETVDFFVENLPATAATPTGTLKFGYSLNAAAATYPFTVTSAGVVTATGAFVDGTGANPASAGAVRLRSGASIRYRNAANGGDIYAFLSNSDDTFQLGDGNAPAVIIGAPLLTFGGDHLVGNPALRANSAVLEARTGTNSAYTPFASAGFQNSGVVTISATAPTIASGGCTSPAVTWNNGTALFLLTLGSSCATVKTITLTMPTAAHFWGCDAENNTSDAQQQTNVLVSRATSTTAVVLTNYARTTGLQADFTAADTVLVKCSGG